MGANVAMFRSFLKRISAMKKIVRLLALSAVGATLAAQEPAAPLPPPPPCW